MSNSMTQSETRPGMTVTDGASRVHDLSLSLDRDLPKYRFHRNEFQSPTFTIFSGRDIGPDEHGHMPPTMQNALVNFAQNLLPVETLGAVLGLISGRRWLMSCASLKLANGDAFPPRVPVIPLE
jgi:hypothetical protein